MAAQKNTGPAVELAVLLMFPCDELEESFTGLEAGADALTPAKTRREEGIVLIMEVDVNEVAGMWLTARGNAASLNRTGRRQ